VTHTDRRYDQRYFSYTYKCTYTFEEDKKLLINKKMYKLSKKNWLQGKEINYKKKLVTEEEEEKDFNSFMKEKDH